MKTMDQALITQMRDTVRNKQSIARALKELHQALSSEQRNKVATIEFAREAFCLSLHEASPIAGWDAGGMGEIDDDRLDALLMPAVESHKSEWDKDDG